MYTTKRQTEDVENVVRDVTELNHIQLVSLQRAIQWRQLSLHGYHFRQTSGHVLDPLNGDVWLDAGEATRDRDVVTRVGHSVRDIDSYADLSTTAELTWRGRLENNR